MGVIKNGYLKGVSGKVDNIVVSKWKDIDVVRGIPNFSDAEPTDNQVTARNRFKSMIDFAKIMKYPVIKPIWNGLSNKMTGTNLFVKTNADAFSEDGSIEDFSKLLLTKGDIEAPTGLTIINDEAGEKSLHFKWSCDKSYAPNSGDDVVNIIIFKKGDTNKHPRLLYDFSTKEEKTADLIVDEYQEGDELNIFVFNSRDNFKLFSDSVCVKLIIDFSVTGA